MTTKSKTFTTITIQPSAHVDHITSDGAELTKLPYPFHVDLDGNVQRQDFWRGKVAWIVGFVNSPESTSITLPWHKAVTRPFDIIGKYVVTADSEGRYSTHLTAIATVLLDGEAHRWLVGGNGRWGQGLTRDEAKANFARFGGTLSAGYDLVHFGSGSEFGGVDNMGRYHWAGDAPEITTVKPRTSARTRP